MLRRRSTPENDREASPEHFIAALNGDDALLANRLHVLRSMGLAEPIDRRRWQVRKDFDAVLRSMRKTADRQQMLASCSALISDERLPMELTAVSRITSLEGRVVGHVLDDATGRTHMVLEGTDAKIHFIPHGPAIESARHKRLLQPSSFVELSSGRGGRLAVEDLGSAEDYLGSERFAAKARRLVQQGVLPADGDWGGWIGRYNRALRSAVVSISKDAMAGRSSRATEPSITGSNGVCQA